MTGNTEVICVRKRLLNIRRICRSESETRLRERKSRVPDTFQLGAICAILAFLAFLVFAKLRVINTAAYSDSPRLHVTLVESMTCEDLKSSFTLSGSRVVLQSRALIPTHLLSYFRIADHPPGTTAAIDLLRKEQESFSVSAS